MNAPRRLPLATPLAASLLSALLLTLSAPVSAASEPLHVESEWFTPTTTLVPTKTVTAAPAQALKPLRYTLPALAFAKTTSTGFGPTQIGHARDLGGDAIQSLPWEQVADGQVAGVIVTSPAAQGMRLGLRVEQLPDAAQLHFYGETAKTPITVSGKEINALMASNRAAGETNAAAQVYWSPLVDGEQVRLDLLLPLGVDPAAVAVTLDQVSHLVTSPTRPQSFLRGVGDGAACNLDAMCYTANWGDAAKAVARLLFTKDGATYTCSGTLLRDTDDTTAIPYLLSAAHCFSDQTAASTLETRWFFESTACNAGGDGSQSITQRGGAVLRYASTATDTLLVQLNDAPPPGVLFSGWRAGLPTANAEVVGIHHPQGDLKKIRFGTFGELYTCFADMSGSFGCEGVPEAAATFFSVYGGAGKGITQGGSSGSGLWMTQNGQQYLVGQLFGGSASCDAVDAPDVYGRFDVAFNDPDGLRQWLAPPSNTVAMAANAAPADGGTVSCTPNPAPRGGDASCTATPNLGFQFTGWGGDCAGTQAVCALTAINSDKTVTAQFAVDSRPRAPMVGLATRGFVSQGDSQLFGGLVLSGTGTKRFLITAKGPSLVAHGITGAVSDVRIDLYRIGNPTTLVASNDDWQTQTGAVLPIPADRAPSHPREAALFVELSAGAYTPNVAGVNGALGVGILEIYDLSPEVTTLRLKGLATRGFVGTGETMLIGGAILGGGSASRLLVTAKGPSMAGLPGVLADPALQIPSMNLSNDNWATATPAIPTASQPSHALEAAQILTLGGGSVITPIVSGTGGGTGIGIVEMYEMD